jgi:hypothetical protein
VGGISAKKAFSSITRDMIGMTKLVAADELPTRFAILLWAIV